MLTQRNGRNTVSHKMSKISHSSKNSPKLSPYTSEEANTFEGALRLLRSPGINVELSEDFGKQLRDYLASGQSISKIDSRETP